MKWIGYLFLDILQIEAWHKLKDIFKKGSPYVSEMAPTVI